MLCRLDFPLPGGERLQARFAAPRAVLRADTPGEVAGVLAGAEAAARAGCWVVGFVSYEAAPAFDAAFAVQAPAGELPLACFAVYDAPQPAATALAENFACRGWSSSLSAAAAAERIEAIRRGIGDGAYYQVNLTMRATSPFAGSPQAFFEALAASQPGAYAAFLDWGEGQILSVSPELFFARVGDRLLTRPMKGTAPRHAEPAADRAAAEALRASEKERAENLMIVDLLRNDLARVAETGSVEVERLFEVEAWPSVWQMTSSIAARARPGLALPELFAALFPCGSVTGAPKVAAMAAIAELEDSPRGIYCGAIGVLQPGGDAVFSVAIRSVSVARGVATCGLGSGITIDSTPAAEYAEWSAKRRFLLRASAPFELLETLRLEDGAFVRLERHLQRLQRSAAWFGFALDPAAARRALIGLAEARGPGAWRVRLLAARDGAVRCEACALAASPAEVSVRLADRPIEAELEFLQHKTTERRAYEAFADLPAGLFDTLLFNSRGELTEFTRGNVFLEQDGVLLTPPLACGLLPGVLRGELLQSGRAREAVLTREQAAAGGRWWFGNSLRGLLPVRFV